MKCLIFYIRNNDFDSLYQILSQNNVEGISYSDINGRGKLKREEVEQMTEVYRTGKKFIPEFVSRKKVEVVVNDSDASKIIESVKKSNMIHGKIFTCDISESFDLP
jgi:nitrogen regulatory protein PII